MTIFESWHSSRAFGRALELPLLAGMARVLAVLMSVYLWIRFLDLFHRDALALLSRNRTETWLFGLEILLLAIPTVLLYQKAVRLRPGALYACVVSLLFGFIANRLNIAVTGMEAGSGTHYIPKWSEVAITLSIVAVGFAVFRVIAHYFPIFEEEPHAASHVEAEEYERVPVEVGRWR
jgi:Ni/Fe-hydrogenase subunit HybB-like protein